MFAFTHVEYNTLQHCNNKKMKSASIISSHVIPNMKTVQHEIHDSEINNNNMVRRIITMSMITSCVAGHSKRSNSYWAACWHLSTRCVYLSQVPCQCLLRPAQLSPSLPDYPHCTLSWQHFPLHTARSLTIQRLHFHTCKLPKEFHFYYLLNLMINSYLAHSHTDIKTYMKRTRTLVGIMMISQQEIHFYIQYKESYLQTEISTTSHNLII